VLLVYTAIQQTWRKELKLFGLAEIREIIPHRGRALLLDRVEVSDDGLSGIGYLKVNVDHCEGHFPDIPIMRGVDRVEMGALTLCVVVMSGLEVKQLPLFDGCGSIKFTGLVRPGDEIRAEVTVQELGRRKMIGSANWFVGDVSVGSVTDIAGTLVNPKLLSRL
jgi:3-hydroxyacyl-[acyl-carrier-protein] dehydratase